eukprot:6710071-Prymnesium_polylepis.1
MTTSLCVLALHGRLANDGNYSESLVVSEVVVVAGGLAWFRRLQAFETDNTRPHGSKLKPHGYKAAVRALLKNDLQPLGKGGGSPTPGEG